MIFSIYGKYMKKLFHQYMTLVLLMDVSEIRPPASHPIDLKNEVSKLFNKEVFLNYTIIK